MIDRKQSIHLVSGNITSKVPNNPPQSSCKFNHYEDKHQKQRSALHPHENYLSNFPNEKPEHKKKNKK